MKKNYYGQEFYELEPIHEGRVSYYGKAHVIVNSDGTRTLQSYNTLALHYDPIMGKYTRFWGGWSATTGRHIKEFALQMDGSWINKKAYFEL